MEATTNREKELLSVLNACSGLLSDSVCLHIQELVRAGHWGVAFEELCSYLHEANAALTRRGSRNSERVGSQMGLDPVYWQSLRKKTTRSIFRL